jgi:hypothetical protein
MVVDRVAPAAVAALALLITDLPMAVLVVYLGVAAVDIQRRQRLRAALVALVAAVAALIVAALQKMVVVVVTVVVAAAERKIPAQAAQQLFLSTLKEQS